MVTVSPSIPVTSLTATTRREPSRSRASWTTRSTAELTCSRIARIGRSIPAIMTIVSKRESESRGEFACTVVSDPSWPVFMACSMSSAAASRTSPTTIRSGRMRSALRTRSRMVTSPAPSMFGGRYSSRSTWSWPSRSSAESSIVMIRSLAGRYPDSTLSSVVFPEPVPPLITMSIRPWMQAARKLATCGLSVPKLIRSSAVYGSTENFRTVNAAPSREIGGTTALTRLPSGSRASTIGLASSTRRPTRATIRSITRRRCDSSVKAVSTEWIWPNRST